jgi:hypothetical protein
MKQILFFLLFTASLYLMVSCTKTNTVYKTVHDTLTVLTKDTLIIKDTIVKKDTLVITNPKNPITGLWVGTYQITGSEYLGSFYYSCNIFADHTFIQQGGGTNGAVWTGKGTWTLTADSTWTADLSNADVSQGSLTQHLTAKYSSVNGTLSQGTWIYTSGINFGQKGTFSLKRTND